MPNIMEIPYFIQSVVCTAILLAIIKVVWCLLKKRREAKKPHISFKEIDGHRVAVLHTNQIPNLQDLDKLFNQALNRLAMDGDVNDEDYSLALAAYEKFKRESNA